MEEKNKYGVVHVFISYILLIIPEILKCFTQKYNKDLFLVLFIISIIVMVDAKMKYDTILIKIVYWNICILFIFFLVFLMI